MVQHKISPLEHLNINASSVTEGDKLGLSLSKQGTVCIYLLRGNAFQNTDDINTDQHSSLQPEPPQCHYSHERNESKRQTGDYTITNKTISHTANNPGEIDHLYLIKHWPAAEAVLVSSYWLFHVLFWCVYTTSIARLPIVAVAVLCKAVCDKMFAKMGYANKTA